MPAGPVPDQFTDILRSSALGHLATVRYVEVRGEVVGFELFNTLAGVNQLARKYTGTGSRNHG
jgi:hypothetical protein